MAERLSCAWALHVSEETAAAFDERERLGFRFARLIAERDAARRKGRRYMKGHRRGPDDSDRAPLDLYGVYYFTAEEAGEGPYCIVCRERIPPDEIDDGIWFVSYYCLNCGNTLRPRKPREDRRTVPPAPLTPAKLATEAGTSAEQVRQLIAAARERAFPGLSYQGIRRRVRPTRRPTHCAECNAALPPDTRPPGERVGRPREYCAECSTPAARVARTRRRTATA